VEQYQRSGLHGGLNYYKTRQVNFEDEKQLLSKDLKIHHPVLMVTVGKDKALPPTMAKKMPIYCTNLTMKVTFDL
jgi:soluble epoxide hydrolase/lipid-phosphate phosphatase